MQINNSFNYRVNTSPSFGVLKISEEALDAIAKRINVKDRQKFTEKLRTIKESQSTNDVEAKIYNHGGSSVLRGSVFREGKYYKDFEESFFSSLFCNPLRFIKKIVHHADVVAEDLKTREGLTELI